ncbi:ATP-binding protein [Actinokineospora guangxiensis]|uniref:ATP-binding protein n=1 Tax=Actinokineospora guangxiensis TaxID=1490288 RepID=A0ABW0EK16_9PSEU
MGRRNEIQGSAGTIVQVGGDGQVHLHGGGRPGPVPRQLPASVGYFTGREPGTAWLDGQLCQVRGAGRAAVAVLVGPPGVGKTALAVRWAHQNRDAFSDGDLYVDLQGFGGSPPVMMERVLERVLRALGVPWEEMPTAVAEQSALYRSLLARKRILVLLDNAASAEQVLPLLPGSSSCFTLITSRNRLGALLVRAGAVRHTLRPLEAAEALGLLGEVMGDERVAAEPAAAEEIVRQCGRLPLALRIAAERAADDEGAPLADLAAELADERDRLDLLAIAEDETAAVRPVFRWSYQALSPEARRVFRLLGLHRGEEIGEQAAAALLGEPLAATRRLLAALADAHLLQKAGPPRSRAGGDRYRCHDLLHVYAIERAVADDHPDDLRAARTRVLAWYLRAADAADRMLSPQRRRVPLARREDAVGLGTPVDAIRWCEVEQANLVWAVRQAVHDGHDEIAWKLPLALWGYFTLRTPWVDWITTYRLGLGAARRTGEAVGEARMLSGLGIALRDLGRYDEALAHFDDALDICHRVGDEYGLGWTLGSKCVALLETARFDAALACSHASLTVFESIGDQHGLGQALFSFGESCRRLGRVPEARDYLDRALTVRRAIGDAWGEARTTLSLADAHLDAGNPASALTGYASALSQWRSVGDRWYEARTLTTLGDLLHSRGDTRAGRTAWATALEICEDLGSPTTADLHARLGAVP